MTRLLVLSAVVVVMLATSSCRAIREEAQLLDLASVNGKYTVMIVYYHRENKIVGVQRRGKDGISYDDLGGSFLTYWYHFDGKDWSRCEAPPEEAEKLRRRMQKGAR